MDKYFSRIENWVMRPYRQDGDVIDWFLFFGLAAVAGYIWAQSIRRIF